MCYAFCARVTESENNYNDDDDEDNDHNNDNINDNINSAPSASMVPKAVHVTPQ